MNGVGSSPGRRRPIPIMSQSRQCGKGYWRQPARRG